MKRPLKMTKPVRRAREARETLTISIFYRAMRSKRKNQILSLLRV
jgi:hypothetical protein